MTVRGSRESLVESENAYLLRSRRIVRAVHPKEMDAGGRLFGKQLATYELAQHRTPEGFGQRLDLMEAQVQEGAVGPERTVGHEKM